MCLRANFTAKIKKISVFDGEVFSNVHLSIFKERILDGAVTRFSRNMASIMSLRFSYNLAVPYRYAHVENNFVSFVDEKLILW